MMCQISVSIPGSPSATVFSPKALIFEKNVSLHGMQTQSLSPCPTSSSTASPWMEDNAVARPKAMRKNRPGRIQIPVVNGFGEENVVEKEETRVEEGEEFSVFCKKGKRRCGLEDRYSAVVDLRKDPKLAMFGVFDGHGGAKAAEFAANNLHKNIMAEISGRCNGDIEDAVRNGYLNTDADFLKQNINGGTCCVTALIHHGNLIISNAGDCRAVLSRKGVPEAITSDHRPSRGDERDRIERLGGYVDQCSGGWRILGTLAVSRAIGDRHLKEWVIAEPETKVLRLEPECEFLILASDGLWDRVSNQEAVDIVRPFCIDVEKPEPFTACKKLVDLSVKRGSTDDVCVLIIQLGCFVP